MIVLPREVCRYFERHAHSVEEKLNGGNVNEEMVELLRNINRNLEILAEPRKAAIARENERRQLREIMKKRNEKAARHRRQLREIMETRNKTIGGGVM